MCRLSGACCCFLKHANWLVAQSWQAVCCSPAPGKRASWLQSVSVALGALELPSWQGGCSYILFEWLLSEKSGTKWSLSTVKRASFHLSSSENGFYQLSPLLQVQMFGLILQSLLSQKLSLLLGKIQGSQNCVTGPVVSFAMGYGQYSLETDQPALGMIEPTAVILDLAPGEVDIYRESLHSAH